MNYRDRVSTPSFRNTAALVACGMVVSGCVSTRQERIGADNGSDVCRTNVVALDSTGNFFGEDLIQAALVGAATGAVAGSLFSVLRGNSKDFGKSMLIGAAAGGIAGVVGGYYKNQMQKGRDQAVLAINQDLEKESAQLDKADFAIKELMACRIRQRDAIRADYAAKRIVPETAQAQWGMLRQQVDNDKRLIKLVSENVGKRFEEYKYANEQMAAEFDISKLPPEEQARVKEVIAENNENIEREQQQAIAEINQDIARKKKAVSAKMASGKKSAAELEKEKSERVAAAKQLAEKKKTINQKTGGNPKMVANTAVLSANQAKKESIKTHEQEFAKNLDMEDGGFEKSSRYQGPVHHFISLLAVCPLTEDDQGVARMDLSWNSWSLPTLLRQDHWQGRRVG